jgi:hypothetical protein
MPSHVVLENIKLCLLGKQIEFMRRNIAVAVLTKDSHYGLSYFVDHRSTKITKKRQLHKNWRLPLFGDEITTGL